MQARGAARGGGVGTPMPRGDGRLGGLLAVAAILVVFALMAAMTWGMGAPATGGLGAEDANLKAGAGAAVVHDDAGSMSSGVSSTVVHDDAGNMAPGAGSLVVHDDAGNVKPY